MKLFVSLNFAVATTVVCLAAGPAAAQTDDYAAPIYGISTVDSYEQRIKSMEAEIKSLGEKVGTVDEGGDVCGCCDPCCNSCCNSCGGSCGYCGSAGVEFRAEALLLSYHRADGSRVGTEVNEHVNPSYNIAPRLTLGYKGCDGSGVRMRWFDYNHSELSGNRVDMDYDKDSVNDPPNEVLGDEDTEFLKVDTFNYDIEWYSDICLNQCWTMEVSFGYRHNDFSEVLVDSSEGQPASGGDLRATFGNFEGTVLGLETRRHFCRGTLYGGLRGSVLFGDRSQLHFENGQLAQANRLNDAVVGIWEISFGYERSWCLRNGALAYVRLGAEVQQWENFSSSLDFDPTAPAQQGSDRVRLGGPADVGFTGFTTAIGIMR